MRADHVAAPIGDVALNRDARVAAGPAQRNRDDGGLNALGGAQQRRLERQQTVAAGRGPLQKDDDVGAGAQAPLDRARRLDDIAAARPRDERVAGRAHEEPRQRPALDLRLRREQTRDRRGEREDVGIGDMIRCQQRPRRRRRAVAPHADPEDGARHHRPGMDPASRDRVAPIPGRQPVMQVVKRIEEERQADQGQQARGGQQRIGMGRLDGLTRHGHGGVSERRCVANDDGQGMIPRGRGEGSKNVHS
ncbi:MAG: hypothetical protein BWZ08_00449 [candidate division BRC1 bacterium ADurb.BinA292]|nr:MAG: hypothetical protein BWZ08_00449 [candidate division BRC1 bacterium ADurb.BinA292]